MTEDGTLVVGLITVASMFIKDWFDRQRLNRAIELVAERAAEKLVEKAILTANELKAVASRAEENLKHNGHGASNGNDGGMN